MRSGWDVQRLDTGEVQAMEEASRSANAARPPPAKGAPEAEPDPLGLDELYLRDRGSSDMSDDDVRQASGFVKSVRTILSSDGDGTVTKEKIEEAVKLLMGIHQEEKRDDGQMKYCHLPERLQTILQEWDINGDGEICIEEVAAAAKAHKRVRKESKLTKIINIGLTLLLVVGVFVVPYISAELAKEMRATGSGVMQTPDGTVVKVGSSDFEVSSDGALRWIRGTGPAACEEGDILCLAGIRGGGGTVKVASSEAQGRLTSALSDESLNELKSLTLRDSSGHAIKATVDSWSRVKVRSSKCGSVVRLNTPSGVMTLDDGEMSMDEALEQFTRTAGMGGLFQQPSETSGNDTSGNETSGGWGRRLRSTDGMLEGFFNILDDVNETCDGQPLPNPEDMPAYYHAVVKVRHLHENPQFAYSRLFANATGGAPTLAGVEVDERGRVFKTWTEELVQAQNVSAILSEFAMVPHAKELRLKRGTLAARMELRGPSGFRCEVTEARRSAMASAEEASNPPKMTFKGLVTEANGLILRHWEMVVVGEDPALEEETTFAMVEAGLMPNVVDFYDVDTDPGNVYQPGHPYRVVMRSTIQGVRELYTEKTYISITDLPSAALDLSGVFEYLNVQRLDSECEVTKELGQDHAGAQALVRDVHGVLPRTYVSSAEGFVMHPPFRPWREMLSSIRFSFDKLTQMRQRDPQHAMLVRAKASGYWSAILRVKANEAVIDASRPVPRSTSFAAADNSTENSTTATTTAASGGSGRRLQGNLSRRSAKLPIGMRERRGRPRRLSTGTGAGWETFESEINLGGFWLVVSFGQEKTSIDLKYTDNEYYTFEDEDETDAAAQSACGTGQTAVNMPDSRLSSALLLELQYCHVSEPLAWSDHARCRHGLASKGDFVRLSGFLRGEVWHDGFPTARLVNQGKVTLDATAGIMCTNETSHVKVLVQGEGTRGMYLNDTGTEIGASMVELRSGASQRFTLVHYPAHEDIVGYKVMLRSARGDSLTYDSVTSDPAPPMWKTVTDSGFRRRRRRMMHEAYIVEQAGPNTVYLKTLGGWYLGTNETGPGLYGGQCVVQLYDGTGCNQDWGFARRRNPSRSLQSNSVSGQVINVSDGTWKSAQVSGFCSRIEFFDKDMNEEGYQDNDIWTAGHSGACLTFSWDLQHDMERFKVWATGEILEPWEGQLAFHPRRGRDAEWRIVNDDLDRRAACRFGHFYVSGSAKIDFHVYLFMEIMFRARVELLSRANPQNGVTYLEKVLVEGRIEAEIRQIDVEATVGAKLEFLPTDPFNGYQEWEGCLSIVAGIRIPWIYTGEWEFDVFCQEFRVR